MLVSLCYSIFELINRIYFPFLVLVHIAHEGSVTYLNKIFFFPSECPQSAFQVAVAANQHLIVQDLVNLGAQVNTTDCWGRTPLHVCAEKGHSQVLQVRASSQLLLSQG